MTGPSAPHVTLHTCYALEMVNTANILAWETKDSFQLHYTGPVTGDVVGNQGLWETGK